MQKEIIERIISSLDQSLKEKGEYVQFNDPSYKPIRISKENFHKIKGTQPNNNVAFVDGGNAEILTTPNFFFSFITKQTTK